MSQGSSVYVFTILALAIIIWRCIRLRVPFLRAIVWVAFAVYVSEVLSRTLFPLPVDPALIAEMRAAQFGSHNWVPLSTVSSMLAHPDPHVRLVQIGGNLLLLLPLGYFLPLLFVRLRRLPSAMAAVLAAALSVEICQLILSSAVFGFAYKAFDVDDIWMNLAGGLIGYGLYKVMERGIPGRDLGGLGSAAHRRCEGAALAPKDQA